MDIVVSNHKRHSISIVVTGVAGAGKSTIGSLLAQRLGYAFEDADRFHSEANVKKMRNAIALCDEDRMPWLMSLNQLLHGWWDTGTSGVLACSALKKQYRDILGDGSPMQTLQFVHLDGTRDLIEKRLAERPNHFMSPFLLTSQFEALECPDCEDIIKVSIEPSPEQIVQQILERLLL